MKYCYTKHKLCNLSMYDLDGDVLHANNREMEVFYMRRYVVSA